MPELPEVETVVRDLRPELTGRRIAAVDLRFPKMVRYPEPTTFLRRLTGRRIEGVERRGKFIVMPLSSDKQQTTDGTSVRLFVHLGMTGHLRVSDPDEPVPRHTHLRGRLDDGRELRFDDQRQFGRLLLGTELEVRAARALPPLGPEPLGPELTPERFAKLLRCRRRPVKAALLDQSFLAGLGNIYADEACFVAGIRPTRHTHRLTVREGKALYSAIRQVLVNSIGARGSSVISYVDGFGMPGNNQEKLLVYGRGGEPCLTCGAPLVHTWLAGRGTVYCRRCQR